MITSGTSLSFLLTLNRVTHKYSWENLSPAHSESLLDGLEFDFQHCSMSRAMQLSLNKPSCLSAEMQLLSCAQFLFKDTQSYIYLYIERANAYASRYNNIYKHKFININIYKIHIKIHFKMELNMQIYRCSILTHKYLHQHIYVMCIQICRQLHFKSM